MMAAFLAKERAAFMLMRMMLMRMMLVAVMVMTVTAAVLMMMVMAMVLMTVVLMGFFLFLSSRYRLWLFLGSLIIIICTHLVCWIVST